MRSNNDSIFFQDTPKWIEQFRRNDNQNMNVEGQPPKSQESDEEDEDTGFTLHHSPERIYSEIKNPKQA